ncbi:MAG: hypothetical protein ABIU05_01590 [Nitrospirales bacterium]
MANTIESSDNKLLERAMNQRGRTVLAIDRVLADAHQRPWLAAQQNR